MEESKKNKLLSFAFFGCFGITAEILFTGIFDFIVKAQEKGVYDFTLPGHSYIWMFFIYGSIAFFLPPAFSYLKKLPLILRLLIYATGIFIVEFISGFLLEQLVGKCPWEYTVGWHIMGYIRLDYAPAWMFFGFVMEKFYIFLVKIGLER